MTRSKLQTIDLNRSSLKLPLKLRKYDPTHVSRYWVIAQTINNLYKKNPKLLDVGGKEGLLRDFGLKSTIIDIEKSNESNYIQGNALEMPFSDKEFDLSVSCDVLEHIAAKDRDTFIKEMLRVSETAIICAPFNNPGISDAEIAINTYHKSILKNGHRWLQEHIDNGLPSEEKTELAYKRLSYNFIKFRHFSLDLWRIILKEHLLHVAFGDNKAVVELTKRMYQEYYDKLCAYDFSQKGYRTFYVVSKNKLKLKLPPSNLIIQKKKDFFDKLSTSLFITIEEQANEMRINSIKEAKLQKSLVQTKAQATQLAKEIIQIKSSKSWKLAKSVSKTKRLITK